MTIIVFLMDTSGSMNTKTYLGTTVFDFAKKTIEEFVKVTKGRRSRCKFFKFSNSSFDRIETRRSGTDTCWWLSTNTRPTSRCGRLFKGRRRTASIRENEKRNTLTYTTHFSHIQTSKRGCIDKQRWWRSQRTSTSQRQWTFAGRWGRRIYPRRRLREKILCALFCLYTGKSDILIDDLRGQPISVGIRKWEKRL